MSKYVVRYGAMRLLGLMSPARGETFERGTRVVTRTDRGLEMGEILSEANDAAAQQLKDHRSGQILRRMSADDENDLTRLNAQLPHLFSVCQKLIAELKLEMELVDAEHVLGGERVVFYYLAENRVDFRELVKRLAAELQTRIEMRQIGVRDEAKLLGDYGDCGKPLCCNSYLIEMPPVSMKMAKLQKATLDPTKISGRCGRLKCCLRYEYDGYVELQRELPPVGAHVLTQRGRSRVLAQEILTSQLLVETEDGRRVLIPAGDVLSVLPKHAPRDSETPEPDRPDRPTRNDRTTRSDRAARTEGSERREGSRGRGGPPNGPKPAPNDGPPNDGAEIPPGEDTTSPRAADGSAPEIES